MKRKWLWITAVIFFLMVNTRYYWEGTLGFFAFPFFIFLAAVYAGLTIALVVQLFFVIKEGFKDKQRLVTTTVLVVVLAVIFYRPWGLIDFDALEGENLLIAQREGVANCMTTLVLKDNFTFREKNVCFGVTEVKGDYHLQNDTIYFDNVKPGRHEDEFYSFAVIKESKFKSETSFSLVRYRGLADTLGHNLWIKKNELHKLKDEKPVR